MKTLLQLWGIPTENTDWDALVRKIERIRQQSPATIAVMGIEAPTDVAASLIDLFHRDGTEVYMWVPTFSELDDVYPFHPLIDANGKAYLETGKIDTFHFRCPGCDDNGAAMEPVWTRLLDGQAYDGLFFDRIRYPSFQFGLSGVLSCFCPECVKKYKAMGLDPDRLKKAALDFASGNDRGRSPFFLQYDEGKWQVGDEGIQQLLDARCRIVTGAVSRAAAFARKSGLKVGLDLFSPALGYFAGQSCRDLLPLADFVKPMMYFRTDAPAGLPYEMDVLRGAVGDQLYAEFAALCGAKTVNDLVRGDVEVMRNIREKYAPSVPVYYGMEYNFVPGLAEITPDTLRQDIPVLKSLNVDGIAGCWSLDEAPVENADAFIRGVTGKT